MRLAFARETLMPAMMPLRATARIVDLPHLRRPSRKHAWRREAVSHSDDTQRAVPLPSPVQREGPSTDAAVIWSRLQRLALPYWTDSEVGSRARWRLAGVVALTLATTGIR